MPLLPKQGYSATVGDAPIFAGRRATAQDFGAPGMGESGLVEAGHRVTATAQHALTDLEEKNSRTALVESTVIGAEVSKELDEAVLSGAPTAPIKQRLLDRLSKIGENLETKKGIDQLALYTARESQVFDRQINQIEVHRAWAKAQLDVQQIEIADGQRIQSDPSYLPIAISKGKDYIATYPGINPEQRAVLEDRLAKNANMAAAMSAARLEPESTIAAVNAGKWNITDEQRRATIAYAEHNLATKRAAEDREIHRIKREQDDRATLARDGYTQRILNGDLGRKLQNDIISDPAFATHPQYREHLVTFMRADAQRLAGQEKRSDEQTKRALYMGLIAPEGAEGKLYNSDKVYEALKAGKLNVAGANFLVGVASGQKDENGRKFSSRLGTQLNIMESAMKEDYRLKTLQADERAAIQMTIASEAEKKASDIRNGRDGDARSPDGMFDPKSKDFFFKPELLRDTAAAVKKQKLDTQMAGAVRVSSAAEMLAQPNGTMMVDPNGKLTPMTEEIRKKLNKTKLPTAVDVPLPGLTGMP